MSRCIYKEIADKLDKKEVEKYYQNHLPREVSSYFGFNQKYFYRIFDYLGIARRSASENTKLQFKNMSKEDKLRRNLKISLSGLGHPTYTETRQKLSQIFKGRVIQYKSEESRKKAYDSRFQPGYTPWNKGLLGCYTQSYETIQKRNESKKRNKTFNSSKMETQKYNQLCAKYGTSNVIRQYSDERYPFRCDFYIPSEDLFIECNYHWTHGGRLFDPEDGECKKKLSSWQEKAKTSRFYQQAIQTWTRRDVMKYQRAKEQQLHYIIYYNYH